MSFLELNQVEKSFGAHQVVRAFNLCAKRGEFISFLGPSGCGKTTVLRMIAGFEPVSAGQIMINNVDVTHLPPNKRKIGMVFQSYALFPNMTVAQNIEFGLKVARLPKEEIAQRTHEMLEMIKLPQLAERYPYQLSGGQQQRVALARAVATKPQILLLDEPLSALDAKIRVSLRQDILNLQRELGITTIFVTHDQEEALSLSDRIVVMSEGHIEQIGAPLEIYNTPATAFVASFIGTLNILEATVVDPRRGRIEVDGQQIEAARGLVDDQSGVRHKIAIRPEAIRIGPDPESGRNHLSGTIKDIHFLGPIVRIQLALRQADISLDTLNSASIKWPERGEALIMNFAREDVLVLEKL